MDASWRALGRTRKVLESDAEWLREQRQLDHESLRFFRLSGKLLLCAIDEYELISVAFFHAVIGLERSMRAHFSGVHHSPEDGRKFAELFAHFVATQIISDSVFSRLEPASNFLTRRFPIESTSHVDLLSRLIPQLRNQYMHGEFILTEDFFPLTIQMREIADALSANEITNKSPTK